MFSFKRYVFVYRHANVQCISMLRQKVENIVQKYCVIMNNHDEVQLSCSQRGKLPFCRNLDEIRWCCVEGNESLREEHIVLILYLYVYEEIKTREGQ